METFFTKNAERGSIFVSHGDFGPQMWWKGGSMLGVDCGKIAGL